MLWLDSLTRDLRYAARLLARTPAFTIPAVASLALGIAVNTALFSVINAALLRPLGGPGTGELVRIGRSVRDDGSFRSVSQEDLRYLREQASSFGAIAGQQIESIVLTGAERSELVSVETVTGNYFSALGVSPAIGRAFTDEDDRAGAAPAVVISDRFWRRRFAGSRALSGSAVRLNDREFTIVGVAPSGFVGTFPGVDTDFWLPAAMMGVARKLPDRREPNLMLLARLRPDVSIETARAELQVLARRLIERDGDRDRGHGFSIAKARGIHPAFARIAGPVLLLLMAVVGLVLLIACINVAGPDAGASQRATGRAGRAAGARRGTQPCRRATAGGERARRDARGSDGSAAGVLAGAPAQHLRSDDGADRPRHLLQSSARCQGLGVHRDRGDADDPRVRAVACASGHARRADDTDEGIGSGRRDQAVAAARRIDGRAGRAFVRACWSPRRCCRKGCTRLDRSSSVSIRATWSSRRSISGRLAPTVKGRRRSTPSCCAGRASCRSWTGRLSPISSRWEIPGQGSSACPT